MKPYQGKLLGDEGIQNRSPKEIERKTMIKKSDKYFATWAFLMCLAMGIYCHYNISDMWASWCVLCAGGCVLIGWWNE